MCWSLREQTEERLTMERNEIYQILFNAKNALKSKHPDSASISSKVEIATANKYEVNAQRIFRNLMHSKSDATPTDAAAVIRHIREAQKVSTLRMYARSVRHVSMQLLQTQLKLADEAQRKGDWMTVEKTVTTPQFEALTTLSNMLPSDYQKTKSPYFPEEWKASKKRKSKKTSLHSLPVDWREQIVAQSSGQFYLPTLIIMLTGCRPQEVANGVFIKRKHGDLYTKIIGAKVVKDKAGQEVRAFKLSDNALTALLSAYMNQNSITKDSLLITLDKPNSVTTHIRALAKRLWPKHAAITSYSGRHAMAADCKSFVALNPNADPDLVSKTLGHRVDKTSSYYGTKSQSVGILGMTPSKVVVTTKIKHKSKARNEARKDNGEIPIKIQGNDKKSKKSRSAS